MDDIVFDAASAIDETLRSHSHSHFQHGFCQEEESSTRGAEAVAPSPPKRSRSNPKEPQHHTKDIDNDDADHLIDAESVWCHDERSNDRGNEMKPNYAYNNNNNNSSSTTTTTNNNDGVEIEAVTVAVVVAEHNKNKGEQGRDTTTTNNNDDDSSYRKHGWIGIGILLFVATVSATGIGVWQHSLLRKKQEHRSPPTGGGSSSLPPALAPNTNHLPTVRGQEPPHDGDGDDVPNNELPFPWESLGEYRESLLAKVLPRAESAEGLLDSYSWTDPTTPQFEALLFVAYQDGAVPGGGDMGYYALDATALESGDTTGIKTDANVDPALLLQRLALLVLYYQTGGGFSWTTSSTPHHEDLDLNLDGDGDGDDDGGASDDDNRNSRRQNRFLDVDTSSTILDDTYYSDNDSDSDNNYDSDSDNNYDWASPGVDECFWDGVICDDNYRVTELLLSEKGLRGTIPTEAWIWLPHLTAVDASENRLGGSLPSNVFWPSSSSLRSTKQYLPNLNALDLSSNEFEGSLPEDLGGGLPSLQILNLGDNLLTGPLPKHYHMGVLEQLHLASNQLTGSLPFDRWFRLSNDSNTTTTTSQGSNVNSNSNSLVLLDLENNLLSGWLPESLGDHPFLEFLSLKRNPLLTGQLPHGNVFQKMTSLRTLLLSDCDLEGSLTSALEGLLGLPLLKRISMASNRLSGSLPSLVDVRNANANANALSDANALVSNANAVSKPFPISVLEALNLGNNAITGIIPPDLVGTLLTSLKYLQFFGNDLEGTIPTTELFRVANSDNDNYNDSEHENRNNTPTLSLLWLHNNPNLEGTMPCPSEQKVTTVATTSPASQETKTLVSMENKGGSVVVSLPTTTTSTSSASPLANAASTDGKTHRVMMYVYDYRADCADPVANVKCSCCRRCF